MKKNIFLLLLLTTFSTFYGQNKNENIKNLISIIYQSYEVGAINNNTFTRLPKSFITTKGGDVKGQAYTYLLGNYNLQDSLIITDYYKEFPTSAKWTNFDIDLVWENNKLSQINYINGPSYRVHQKDGSKIVSFSKKIDDVTNTLYSTVLTPEGNVAQVMYFSKKTYNQKPKIHGDRTYKYENNKVTVKNVAYNSSVNPTDKDIFSVSTSVYSIEPDNVYKHLYTVDDKKKHFELSEILRYESNGLLQQKKSVSSNDNGNSLQENYTYIDNKLYKKVVEVISSENKLLSKRISIEFDNPTQDSSLENYEQKKGNYEFDSNLELVYETNDHLYRRKINGVWEPWKYIEY